jgi:hypothetical protein
MEVRDKNWRFSRSVKDVELGFSKFSFSSQSSSSNQIHGMPFFVPNMSSSHLRFDLTQLNDRH